MDESTLVLVAEDDDGHYALIERNLARSGITNPIVRFRDGREVVDFLQDVKNTDSRYHKRRLLLLLDIRLPKLDGIEVLRRIKTDRGLEPMPVIMLTTAADNRLIEQCKGLGCNMYVVKPVDYHKFIASIQKISQYISTLDVPVLPCN